MLNKNNLIFKLNYGICVVFFLSFCQIFGQIQVSFSLLDLKSPPTTVDLSLFHNISSSLKATQNGSVLVLTPDNIVVIENNRAVKPSSVALPDAKGFQKVLWVSTLVGSQNPETYIQFLVFNQQEITTATAQYPGQTLSHVRFKRGYAVTLEGDYSFGNIPAGSKRTDTIIVQAQTTFVDNHGIQQGIRVDSITTQTPFFHVNWLGNYLSTDKPPVDIYSPANYDIEITFAPQDNKYYRDIVKVYYSNGGVEEAVLIGNSFSLPAQPTMKILTPKNTDILTPCQTVTITWQGTSPDFPAIIDYSPDAGKSWKNITSVKDVSFLWTVPDDVSDSVKLRISQSLQDSRETQVADTSLPVNKIAFSADSKYFLTTYQGGMIVEWDALTLKANRTLNIRVGSRSKLQTLGLGYTIDGGISLAFRTPTGNLNFDSLAYFPPNSLSPSIIAPIQNNFKTKQAYIHSQSGLIFCVPEIGTEILTYYATTLTFSNSLSFSVPVAAFSMSGSSKVAVALYDGSVQVLSVPSFSVQKTIYLPDLPIVACLALSPNDSLLAIGCRVSQPTIITGAEADVHIMDIASNQIIRSLYSSASNPISMSFNASSRYLVLGFEAIPQVSLWKLPDDVFSGSLVSHSGLLTDAQFSPDGKAIVSCSNGGNDNLKYRRFTYPESVTNDGFLRIIPPIGKISETIMPSVIFGFPIDSTLKIAFCNQGQVPIIIGDAHFRDGWYFHLKIPFAKDTLLPGACLNLTVTFAPQDTGYFNDKLLVSTCSRTFELPVFGRGLNRKITLIADGFDFGNVCVGDALEKEIPFIRNDDTIPVTINRFSVFDAIRSPFFVVSAIQDTILKPGQVLLVKIRFAPTLLGAQTGKYFVYHSGQTNIRPEINVKGYGAGADLQASLDDVRFIPEILKRQFALKNETDNPITITSFNFSTTGTFSIQQMPPITIPAHAQTNLDVSWNGTATSDVSLFASLLPCGVKTITLGMYNGSSVLSIPIISADPSGSAVIPLFFSNGNPKNYNGTRIFDAEFTINQHLFFPQSVSSDYGVATLTRNDVSGDKRTIGVHVEGNFPTSGTTVRVQGLAGLGDTASCPIDFIPQSQFWGKSVSVKSSSGMFDLANLCGSRRLLMATAHLIISDISPNPAQEKLGISLESTESGNGTLEIFDRVGQQISLTELNNFQIGANSMAINLPANATSGVYLLVAKLGGLTATSKLIIAR